MSVRVAVLSDRTSLVLALTMLVPEWEIDPLHSADEVEPNLIDALIVETSTTTEGLARLEQLPTVPFAIVVGDVAAEEHLRDGVAVVARPFTVAEIRDVIQMAVEPTPPPTEVAGSAVGKPAHRRFWRVRPKADGAAPAPPAHEGDVGSDAISPAFQARGPIGAAGAQETTEPPVAAAPPVDDVYPASDERDRLVPVGDADTDRAADLASELALWRATQGLDSPDQTDAGGYERAAPEPRQPSDVVGPLADGAAPLWAELADSEGSSSVADESVPSVAATDELIDLSVFDHEDGAQEVVTNIAAIESEDGAGILLDATGDVRPVPVDDEAPAPASLDLDDDGDTGHGEPPARAARASAGAVPPAEDAGTRLSVVLDRSDAGGPDVIPPPPGAPGRIDPPAGPFGPGSNVDADQRRPVSEAVRDRYLSWRERRDDQIAQEPGPPLGEQWEGTVDSVALLAETLNAFDPVTSAVWVPGEDGAWRAEVQHGLRPAESQRRVPPDQPLFAALASNRHGLLLSPADFARGYLAGVPGTWTEDVIAAAVPAPRSGCFAIVVVGAEGLTPRNARRLVALAEEASAPARRYVQALSAVRSGS